MLGPGRGLLVELHLVVLTGMPVVAVVVEFGPPCCYSRWVQGFCCDRCSGLICCLLMMMFRCMLFVLGIGLGICSVQCLMNQSPGCQC